MVYSRAMQAIKILKYISKKNVIWGIIHCTISFPFIIYGMATIEYMSHKKKQSFASCVTEILQIPSIYLLILLVILNTACDFLIYKNTSKNILKRILISFNIIYFLYFLAMSCNGIESIPHLVIILIIILVFIRKLKLYYFYYKCCKAIQGYQY